MTTEETTSGAGAVIVLLTTSGHINASVIVKVQVPAMSPVISNGPLPTLISALFP